MVYSEPCLPGGGESSASAAEPTALREGPEKSAVQKVFFFFLKLKSSQHNIAAAAIQSLQHFCTVTLKHQV